MRLLVGAAVITAIQILGALLVSNPAHPLSSYVTLWNWDSGWYADIIEKGYHSTIPPVGWRVDLANVAFFPGYPLVAKFIWVGTKLPLRVAMVLASHLAALGFWFVILKFFERWHVPRRWQHGAILAMISYPSAFYLVTAYSESLFLFCLLAFLYFLTAPTVQVWKTVPVGFLMTATRIVGLPLALLPLVKSTAGLSRKTFIQALVMSGLASLGGLLFFAYCQIEFGHWDLYMKTQYAGWKLVPEYAALFDPKSYGVFLPTWQGGKLEPNEWSRLSIPAITLLFVLILLAEIQRLCPKDFLTRFLFYFSAATQFFVSASGLYARTYISMIRYTYPVYVLLVMAFVLLCVRSGRSPPRVFKILGFGLAALLLAVQGVFIWRFTHGWWVA